MLPTEVLYIWGQLDKGKVVPNGMYFSARYLNLIGSLLYVALFTSAGSEVVSELVFAGSYLLIFLSSC